MSGSYRRLATIGALGSLLLLAACGGYGDDIATVKQSEAIPGKTNEQLVNDVAGARGTVKWKGSKPDRFSDTDIVLVQAKIKETGSSGKEHKIEFDFLNNRGTKKVALDAVLVDGEHQNLLTLPLNLFKLQLD